jgi:hypothetical protein
LSAAACVRFLTIRERAGSQIKEARLQSELEVKEEKGALTSYILELLGQLLVLFLQGEEAPTNL